MRRGSSSGQPSGKRQEDNDTPNNHNDQDVQNAEKLGRSLKPSQEGSCAPPSSRPSSVSNVVSDPLGGQEKPTALNFGHSTGRSKFTRR